MRFPVSSVGNGIRLEQRRAPFVRSLTLPLASTIVRWRALSTVGTPVKAVGDHVRGMSERSEGIGWGGCGRLPVATIAERLLSVECFLSVLALDSILER